jgi:TRAP-type C4-dicarboxylate transport system permease large subunit
MDVAGLVQGLPWPSWVIMGIICVIYLIGGCFIDSLAMMMLTVPIFFPIVVNLGYDPIWFGIIIVLVTHMGIITPPVGISVYIIRGIAPDVPLTTIFKGCLPFLIALMVGVAAMIAFPEIVTGFPSIFE